MTWIFALVLFTISLGAGIGGIYLHGRVTKDVKVLLAFSGAYLFALAVLHLLPEIYIHLQHQAGLYILLGFLIQMAMDHFSRGVEHGHVHPHITVRNSFPYGIYISLFLHSIIEGLPLGGGFDHSHGSHVFETENLLIGIAIHKIPEAIALAAILYHVFKRKTKVIAYIGFYALATPMGILIGNLLLDSNRSIATELYSIILAIAVGIFLHVSTTIIFEAEESHKLNWPKFIAIILGLCLVLIL
jgi:zinc transporter ZupT